MKLKIESDGYIRIGLNKDKNKSYHCVHRLVSTAFCNKEDNCNVVDHIDRNRANNNYQNLRWTTTSGNCRNRTIRRDNTSGISGVAYDKKNFWTAWWYDINMKQKCKYFSVKKLGDEQAKQMAINYRKQMAEANGYINV